jgi:hypothetical protein
LRQIGSAFPANHFQKCRRGNVEEHADAGKEVLPAPGARRLRWKRVCAYW